MSRGSATLLAPGASNGAPGYWWGKRGRDDGLLT